MSALLIGGWWSAVVDASVGVGDGDRPVRVEDQVPAALMHGVVMFGAEGQEIGEVCVAEVADPVDVVGLAVS